MVFLVKVRKSEYNIVIEKKIEKYHIKVFLSVLSLSYFFFIPCECCLKRVVSLVRKKNICEIFNRNVWKSLN